MTYKVSLSALKVLLFQILVMLFTVTKFVQYFPAAYLCDCTEVWFSRFQVVTFFRALAGPVAQLQHAYKMNFSVNLNSFELQCLYLQLLSQRRDFINPGLDDYSLVLFARIPVSAK